MQKKSENLTSTGHFSHVKYIYFSYYDYCLIKVDKYGYSNNNNSDEFRVSKNALFRQIKSYHRLKNVYCNTPNCNFVFKHRDNRLTVLPVKSTHNIFLQLFFAVSLYLFS